MTTRGLRLLACLGMTLLLLISTLPGYGRPAPSPPFDLPRDLPTPGAQAVSFTVVTTGDEVDASPGDGQCRTAGGECTLRAAIIEANALPGAQTITLPNGVYKLTIPGQGEDAARTGDLDITDHLTIIGATTSGTIIDANGLDRVFDVLASARVTVAKVTMRNGKPEEAYGGGVRSAGRLLLEQVLITGNTVAPYGGVVFNTGGSLAIAFSRIIGNSATNPASVIFNDKGVLAITDTHVSDNSGNLWYAIYNGGGSARIVRSHINNNNGTGIVNDGRNGVLNISNTTIAGNKGAPNGSGGVSNFYGALMITDSKIIGNACGHDTVYGGGVMNEHGTATLVRVTVSGNSCGYSGGGVANKQFWYTPMSKLIITDSTISGNSALHGGGIMNYSELTLTNVTLSNNVAYQSGGGLGNHTASDNVGAPYAVATALLTNVTVGGGRASSGGGIFNTSKSSVQLRNTIVANSASGQNCSGTITSLGNNLDSGNTCGFMSLGDRSNTDPKLGPLANNGGPTETHALRWGSPAIDAGSLTDCSSTDQRGVARPRDGNGDGQARCDIGAFER